MSLQARAGLVNHPNTVFQSDSQKTDLLDERITQTDLIAFLLELVNKGHILEFTAIKSDHHDDSDLGEHCHYYGWCADVWPLDKCVAGAYLDPDDNRFQRFLADAAASKWVHQIGLAGSAWQPLNQLAAGNSVFHDGGEDHVHLGAQ